MLSLLCICFVFLGILGPLLDGAPTVTWLGIGGTGITLVFVLEAVLDVSLVFLFENGDIELKEDETEVRQGLLAGALVCAFLAICVFMCKLFVIWGKLLGVIWGLEYAEKDKKQQLLGVIWGLQYDAEKDINQQLHGLKKILFRFSNPVGIALSDTADVLLLVQIVIPPKIIVQPKIFIISIFLILNVVLSEFQTLIGTVKQLIDETWGLEYAEKDKKQQLLGVIWGLEYDAEKDKNQQLHGLKKILFRFSNPVGIALSDTADVLLLVQIVIPPKIIVQPKIFIISIFLILNVVLSEFQTLIGTVKQLIDETLREGETLEERNDNLKRTENIRNIMRLKARVQTLLVGNLIIPIVLALSLRKNFSVSESLLVCLPILGFGFAVLNIVTERYFQWRLFASTLNEASRDILVRSLTVIWAIILGVTNIIDSLNRNRRLFIFLFYAVYSLVPLILRIIQEWKTKNVAIMYDRPLGVNVKEKDTKTNMLFRNPIADSLVYYVNQNAHPDIIVNKVIKSALITKGASGLHLIRKDVAFSTYTLCEARLGNLRGETKSRMLNVVAMAVCGVYCEDYGTESFHETLTRILAENYKIDMPGIHSLSLGKCELTVENVLKHLCLGNILAHKSCPIASLDLGGNGIGADGAVAIGDSLRYNKTLKILFLQWNGIGPQGGIAIGDALRHNDTLTSLDLYDNQIRDEGASRIADALKINQSLQNLNLRWNNIKDEGASRIADALKINKSLQNLNLGSNEIGDNGAVAIGNAILKNKKCALVTLHLRGNKIDARGAEKIAEVLKINNTLQELNLDDNDINGTLLNDIYDFFEGTAKHIISVFAMISPICTCTYKKLGIDLYSLEANEIGPEGAGRIADALKINKCLQNLNLGFNFIKDEGASRIADALKINKSLQNLNLGSNEIGDNGAVAIGNAILKNKKCALVTLHLRGNKIDARGAEKIAEVLKINNTLQELNLDDNDINGTLLNDIYALLRRNR
eukprot:CAMPEP_0204843886 /NCGR_PEP_ID=MMETSP1346-20131115/48242_1 /ASSEMBLY_ACC=CAM_ASM_000771 /TAXON_ID=215587 /ORGANISM="Aplanochytrium stocchinoi, Strain GSBS06" /LENGTH=984 /DNA_ID=CAMNT_0051983107 /DNA_START=91 /DNA_END=3046 /DNA_ORIENTATION=+